MAVESAPDLYLIYCRKGKSKILRLVKILHESNILGLAGGGVNILALMDNNILEPTDYNKFGLT